MMDYNKTRTEAEARKQSLLVRLKEIPSEKTKLDEEIDQIKRELIGIDQILDGLAFMDSNIPPDFEPVGFTDNVRKILSETLVPLVPTQIRDALEAKGITGSTSKNLLINVHKVLERIESELDKTTTTEGKTAYKRKLPWGPGGSTPNLYDLIMGGNRPLIATPQDVANSRESGTEHPMRAVFGRPRESFGQKIGRKSSSAFYGESSDAEVRDTSHPVNKMTGPKKK
jgi:hypothetical protein